MGAGNRASARSRRRLQRRGPRKLRRGWDAAVSPREAFAGSFRRVVPLGCALLVEGGGVFGENPALVDQVVDGFAIAGEVVVAAGVALGDREPGIAGGVALGFGFCEGEEGAKERG